MERLQKVIAQSNICSRRKAEKLILEKRVTVNGIICDQLGTNVSKKDIIKVDDNTITRASYVYYLLNKPTGVIANAEDSKNRRTIIDFLEPEDQENRIYPVGRLDFDTAGLLILTNDGELTKKLTHPSSQIEKQYIVRVEGIVIKDKIRTIRKGIIIDKNHFVIPKEVQLLEIDKTTKTSLIRIIIRETTNKQVRKMMEKMGHKVINLTRDRYAFLNLDGVKRGTYRKLKVHEVKKLMSL